MTGWRSHLNKRSPNTTIALVGILALGLTACGGGTGLSRSTKASSRPSPSNATALSVGYIVSPVGNSLLDIGQAKGLFTKYGIRLHLVSFETGSALGAAIVGGSVDTGLIGGALPVFATQGDGTVYYVQSAERNENFVFAHHPINSISALKGQTIALPLGTTAEVLLYVALHSVGLSLSDVQMLNTSPSGAAEAFLTKKVPAAVTWPPPSAVVGQQDPKVQVLTSSGRFPSAQVFDGWVAEPNYIASHKALLSRFVSALSDAASFLLANPGSANSIIYNASFKGKITTAALGQAMSGLEYATASQWATQVRSGALIAGLNRAEQLFLDIGGLKRFVPASKWFTPTVLDAATSGSNS